MRKASRSNPNNEISHLIRPVPVRIETQRLYDSAAEHGINTAQVHAALEWQRQWTTYNEPTTTHSNTIEPIVLPPHAQWILDREQGARNPSPGNSNPTDDDEEDGPVILRPTTTKRARDAGEWDAPIPDEKDDEDDPVSDLSTSPQGFFADVVTEIVRPVAIRANRGAPGLPPAHILEEEETDPERPMSPLTLYSSGSNSQASFSPYASGGMIGGMMVSCAAPTSTTGSSVHSEKEFDEAREGLLNAIAVSGGDADDEDFQNCLRVLEYSNANTQHSSKGMWLTLTKPTFFGCLGLNDEGDPLYTLARMSFDMFTPGDLVCSLQGNFNQVEDVLDRTDLVIPKSLMDEVRDRKTTLKTYNIITAFTIEPTSATEAANNAAKGKPQRTILRPIRATMTTFGYMIPDPTEPGRNSVWITGGRMEPNATPEDTQRWKELFADGKRPPHEWAAAARILAVKWLMGAELNDHADPITGAFEYKFTRPLGGHGLAYIDTLYMDESLRIVRGHRGTIFCFARVE